MSIILTAIVPTIVLLVLGNLLRRRAFLPREFWAASDKLTYFILFPALLITKVSQVDLSSINFVLVSLFFIGYFLLASLMVWVIYRITHAKPHQFSSIYQGIVRFNSYVYFAIIEAVWGHDGLALAALIAGLVIPIVNVCCVAAFSVGSGAFALLPTLKNIAKNPLIIGALLGFVANLLPVLLPNVLFNSLLILSTAALPLALLSVGAAVQIKMLVNAHESFSRSGLWLTAALRLVILPLLALLMVELLAMDSLMQGVLVIFAAVPTATSSFILAKQLGGDAEMMASIISLQTVLSLLTLIIWLGVLL